MGGIEKSFPDNHGVNTAGKIAVISVAIAAFTLVAYLGVYYNEFIFLDDKEYVLSNPHVQQGITPKSIAWAFSAVYSSNWHPLTWISHMADWRLYGSKPAGHHMTSAVLHAVNASLLFLLLVLMTGLMGRSALVALLFALHPLHVESVAWVSERKDVLCAFFWFLTMLAYAWYVRKPSRKRFLSVAAGFACALMSKPMAVTLPFTLLLLDYWPLRRVTPPGSTTGQRLSAWGKLIAEKWLLYVMALVSCAVTLYAQKAGSSVTTLEEVPLWARAGNAVITYWQYIAQMFWPDPLAVYYYHESRYLGFPFALLLAVLLLLATAGFWQIRKKAPFCVTGWLWYVGTLIPVIGIVQVGMQARADRYTYVPLTGLFVMLVWGVGEFVRGRPSLRRVMLAAAVAAVAAMAVKTVVQLGVWQNSVTLCSHAVEKDPRGWNPNVMLSMNLFYNGRTHEAQKYFERAQFSKAAGHCGPAFREFCRLQERDSPEARQCFDRMIFMAPNRNEVLNSMTEWCLLTGRPADAETYGRRLLAIAPDSIKVRVYLAQALLKQNKLPDAEREYREVLRRDSSNVEAYNNVAFILADRKSLDEAVAVLRRSLAIRPGQPLAHYNMGRVFIYQKRFPAAVIEFSEALRLDPACAEAHNDLGSALAAQGDIEGACLHYRRAIELNPRLARLEDAMKSLKVLEERLHKKPEQPQ